jgi:hypothetical protein
MVFNVISSSQKKNDEHSLCSGAFTHLTRKKVKRHPVLRRTWKNQAFDFMYLIFAQ